MSQFMQNKFRFFSYFVDLNNTDTLISTCKYCQRNKQESTRRYKSKPTTEPKEDEKKCIRCEHIYNETEFIWTSKDGKRTKFVKTCSHCREVDKNFRTKMKPKNCTHNKIKKNCGICKVLSEKLIINITGDNI